jgi:hypothetical protein
MLYTSLQLNGRLNSKFDFQNYQQSVLEYREKLGMAATSLRADTIQKLIAQMYHEMRTYFGSVRARLRERSCAGGE